MPDGVLAENRDQDRQQLAEHHKQSGTKLLTNLAAPSHFGPATNIAKDQPPQPPHTHELIVGRCIQRVALRRQRDESPEDLIDTAYHYFAASRMQ
jgi:hypothetical protein